MNLFSEDYLVHHGIKGQKWGVRRFQNADGTRTDAGKKRYQTNSSSNSDRSSNNAQRRAGVLYPLFTSEEVDDYRQTYGNPITKKDYERYAGMYQSGAQTYARKAEKAKTDKEYAVYSERARREQQRAESYLKASMVEGRNAVDRMVKRSAALHENIMLETVRDIRTGEEVTRGRIAAEQMARDAMTNVLDPIWRDI